MTVGLYKITNTVNGKYYIGSSNDIDKRWFNHKSTLKRGKHRNCHLQASFNKYGADAFVFEIIEELPPDTSFDVLRSKEQVLIDCISDEEWSANLYNIMRSVDVIEIADETKKKISESGKRKWADPEHREYMKQFSKKGIPLSEEHRKKIGDGRRGKKMPPDVVKRISQNRIGIKLDTDWAEKARKAGRKTGAGVYQDKKAGTYYAMFCINNKQTRLGTFKTYEEALQARLEAEAKYWG